LAARVEQTEKMQVSEEEKKLINKELECLKRELTEKAQELNNERLKVENLIRNEQVLILKNDL
jgi:phage-related minor tail protein